MRQNHQLSDQYLDLFSRPTARSLRSRKALPRYLEWLFDEVSLRDKVIFDIGGGTGLISFYVAEQGARRVVCVEPLGEGSREDMLAQFEIARSKVRNGSHVSLKAIDLRQFAEQADSPADILILHNVVNHLDENACRRLHVGDVTARRSFVDQFRIVRDLLGRGGLVIVADAGRHSFWSDYGMPNPFAPTIDRSVHQQPEVWQELLEEAGFEMLDVRWTPFLSLMTSFKAADRRVGPRSLSSYYSLAHFVLRMRRPLVSTQ